MSGGGGRPRVVVAGGGVAGLEAALALRELVATRLDLTLLSAWPDFEYRPLSVAEPFDLGRAHRFELRELLDGRGVEVLVDSLAAVDLGVRQVRTASERALPFEALLVAIGARRERGVPGAVHFAGAGAANDVRRLLHEAAAGRLRRLLFAVPPGVTWSLPAYELALMSAAHFAEREIEAEVAVVSPEERPLEAFGERAGAAVAEMLATREIAFHSAVPARAESGRLAVERGEPLAADAVVALPRLVPVPIEGLPVDERGFLPTDAHGRVAGLDGVYAAGDISDFPLKQGGIAAQQADAAAEAIAADLGGEVRPRPFRPVLRGLLLTGRAPRYLRAEIVSNRAARSTVEEEATWWPPAKIAGRRLGPLLALHGASGGAPPGTVALELDASAPSADPSPPGD